MASKSKPGLLSGVALAKKLPKSPAARLQMLQELMPGRIWCDCHQRFHKTGGVLTKKQALSLLDVT